MLQLNEIAIETGNTVRFTVTFTDFDKNPVEPDTALFKVFNRRREELSSNPMIKAPSIEGDDRVGVYYYYYTPIEDGEYTVEMYGIIDNKPALIRKKIKVGFDVTKI